MTSRNDKLETTAEDPADVLLQQLLHLKQYEIPDPVRMTRNKQNIMRRVREQAGSRSSWSLADLLEVNIPWFFAEPRYGIAALFIVFAGLQFLGVSSKQQAHNKTGIYTSGGSVAAFDPGTAISSTNTYPRLPDNLQLFASPRAGDGSIRPVILRQEKR